MKVKKILSLILAVVMVLSIMAISVSAATTRAAACDACGSSNTRTTLTNTQDNGRVWTNGCDRYPQVGHYHNKYINTYIHVRTFI